MSNLDKIYWQNLEKKSMKFSKKFYKILRTFSEILEQVNTLLMPKINPPSFLVNFVCLIEKVQRGSQTTLFFLYIYLE